MKKGIYQTLAWTGIKKNKKLYFPYILTCIGMVMMCYIVSFLSTSTIVGSIPGGETMQGFLEMGFSIMCVFSAIFLFYTNSFLIRRRKKEFGLYNILGLGKKNLGLVLFLETLMIAVITIVSGLFFGILFSKFAELGMVKILGGEATFTFIVEYKSIVQTMLLFAVIFLLIFLNGLCQIRLSNPIQLLRSENAGEKPPKANWIVAVLGVIIMVSAYYLAVSIEDPLSAMIWFFVAAVMVIIATYLLFIAGSVALCRILQKNKKYYYKTNHFVSVSSMVYRMKRNGAGLASICILCTMVLVMVSSTVCLYIGTEDSLRSRFPRNINLDVTVNSVELLNGEQTEKTKELIQQIVKDKGTVEENTLTYSTAAFGGVIDGDRILFNDSVYANRISDISEICQFFIVPLSDYNRLMGKEETLAAGEVLLYTTKELKYDQSTIQIGDETPLTVKKHVDGFVDNGVDSMQIFPTMYLFVPDMNKVIEPLQGYTLGDEGQSLVSLHWYYAFDLPCDDGTQIEIQNLIAGQISKLEEQSEEFAYFHVFMEGVAKERSGFYGMYGGLFFLGVLLGTVFIFAAVLIIYYKQISEGYEDQSRFAIMQKVGMTKKEIKKSINSQILTVFFLPLITAGVHLSFAFPLIRKLLLLFSLKNFTLLITVTVGCYLIFALLYMLVYRATSKSYFSIVSGMRGENE